MVCAEYIISMNGYKPFSSGEIVLYSERIRVAMNYFTSINSQSHGHPKIYISIHFPFFPYSACIVTSCVHCSWWRHQMETFSALLALCAGNSPVPGEFPAQRPVTRSFDVFFELRLNKQLNKQSWGWWFETRSRSLWCHRNVFSVCVWLFIHTLISV